MHKGEKFGNIPVVKKVRGLNEKRFVKLISIIEGVLDGTARSIAHRNVRLIGSGHIPHAVVVMTVKSPLLVVKGVRNKMIARIRRWLGKWPVNGAAVLMKMRTTTTAAGTILTELDNTQFMAKQVPEYFV